MQQATSILWHYCPMILSISELVLLCAHYGAHSHRFQSIVKENFKLVLGPFALSWSSLERLRLGRETMKLKHAYLLLACILI